MRRTETGDDAWLTNQEVAARLGVQPATVYAYVSRGLLSSERLGRRSRYRLSEVDALRERMQMGQDRAPAVGKPIFRIDDGIPRYRDIPVLELAAHSTYERVAELLWTGELATEPAWPPPPQADVRMATDVLDALPDGVILSEKLKVGVAALGALDHAGSSYYAPEVASSGRQFMMAVIHALRRADGQAEPVPATYGDRDLAAHLWRRLTTADITPERIALLDSALVLTAEHGMAPSTMVARTAASLGATIYGVVSGGLGAGTGDATGSSALVVEDLLRRLHRSPHAIRGIVEQARIEGRVPGFGHFAYPNGDVRARYLLMRLAEIAGDSRRFEEVSGLIRVMQERGLPPPNTWFALASMAHCFDMIHGSVEATFFIGRSAGWIAHAINEYRRE